MHEKCIHFDGEKNRMWTRRVVEPIFKAHLALNRIHHRRKHAISIELLIYLIVDTIYVRYIRRLIRINGTFIVSEAKKNAFFLATHSISGGFGGWRWGRRRGNRWALFFLQYSCTYYTLFIFVLHTLHFVLHTHLVPVRRGRAKGIWRLIDFVCKQVWVKTTMRSVRCSGSAPQPTGTRHRTECFV